METILLIDIENQSVSNLETMLTSIYHEVSLENRNIFKIGFVSKDQNLINKWRESCHNIFHLNTNDIISLKTKSGTNSSDIGLSLLTGYLVGSIKKANCIVYTEDKILSSTLRLIVELGGNNIQIKSINKKEFATKKNRADIKFNKTEYPFINQIDRNIFPRFVFNTKPRNLIPDLEKIIIHDYGNEITLGKSGSDLNIDYWDNNNRSTVYSNHLFIGFNSNSIYLRSSKGFRRGKHAFKVNDVIKCAADGNIELRNHDKISLGGFQFEVIIPKRFTNYNRTNNPTSIQDRIGSIELNIHKWIKSILYEQDKNWWPNKIADKIVESCIGRCDKENEHPYNFTVLSDLEKIIINNWDIFSSEILAYFPSKKQFRKTYSKFLRIRNVIMHPTRISNSENDKEFITNLNILIGEITKPNNT